MLKAFLQALKHESSAASIWEISFVVACVLVSEWISPFLFGKNWYAGAVPALIALAFIILSQFAKGETLKEQGWRIDNLFNTILLIVPPMLLGTVVLLMIGWLCSSLRVGSISLDSSLIWIFVGLFIWGLTQQFPLQAFINRRAQMIWGGGTVSVVFTAAVFALLHLPNLWLMAATFFGGLMWAYVYQHTPNLWVLALSHAVMTAVLAVTVPYSALHGLRVGYNYF